jgi:hypothetical protein
MCVWTLRRSALGAKGACQERETLYVFTIFWASYLQLLALIALYMVDADRFLL